MYASVIGYGRMGKLVHEVLKERNHAIVSTVDPDERQATHKTISGDALRDAEVCICFTRPSVALENIRDIAQLGKNMVVGTTGWYDSLNDAKEIVARAKVGLIFSANFSIGVNIFFRCVEIIAGILNSFPDYDVFVTEQHHKGKVDSPSGTARELGKILLRNLRRKQAVVTERLDRRIGSEELHVASVRGGFVPGVHCVTYDSEVDTIELCHTARSRKGFAVGAVMAAEWILNKKGVYTKDDMLKDVLE